MDNRFLLCSSEDEKNDVLFSANTIEEIDDKTTNYEDEESLLNNFNKRANEIYIYDQETKKNIQIFYKNTRRNLIEYFIENSPEYERSNININYFYNNMDNMKLRKLANIHKNEISKECKRK